MLNVVLVEFAEGRDCLSLFTAVRATTTWSLWRGGSAQWNDVVSEVRDAKNVRRNEDGDCDEETGQDGERRVKWRMPSTKSIPSFLTNKTKVAGRRQWRSK